ncbi:Transmembrane 9 superfamily member [Quillaja saponaria]|uniref:Transmembrane 9 superfamily member n=1 Tax=Quillaja saponaria TaxID=32244 RepID=A0AAD7KY86_QUISA|nr:Transmembrane 9 superfamily member [Quillaja saponaria]
MLSFALQRGPTSEISLPLSPALASMTSFLEVRLFLVFLTLALSTRLSTASPADHRYNVGDQVPLFVNKVGPLNNPSETYEYYDFPFCRPDPVIKKKESLGEVLNGDRLASSLYTLKFREDKTGELLCQKKLTVDEIAKFKHAVNNEYYFQMYYDDLPLWGFIGKVEDQSWTRSEKGPNYYLFQHVHFDVLYNGDRVIEVHAFSDPTYVVDITEDVELDVKFTYTVKWSATSAYFENRMDIYSKASLLPIRWHVHWFSLINSIVILLLLMGLVTLLYVRHLKNDLRKYSNSNEEDKDVLGTGSQLLTVVFILFFLAFLGILYPYNRGGLFNCLVLLYSLASAIAGYSASSFHCQFTENGLGRTVLLAGVLYTGPLFVTVSVLNMVAVSYGTTAALPFGSIVVILLIYTFLAIPLLALGAVIGYHFRSEFQAPSATSRYPREIPQLTWYRRTPRQMFIGGLLPFSAIALQLHQLYASMWSYKIYTLPPILFVMFIILILITAILSAVLTYIQLSVEDHEWWWRSVLCGGSTAFFMFGCCIYFYARSSMNNFMQLSFFIGYNACMCYAFFLMLGTISFRASLLFVRHIYHVVKSE